MNEGVFIVVGFGVGIGLVMLGNIFSIKRCWLGRHRNKKYVAIRKGTKFTGVMYDGIYDGKIKGHIWIIRWVCPSCGKLGESYKSAKKGAWTIVDGKLVPDEKMWAEGNE